MNRLQLYIIIFITLSTLISPLNGQNTSERITGILGSYDKETALFKKHLQNQKQHKILGVKFITGSINGRNIVIAETSFHKVNAAMTTTLLIEHFKPREVIFSGIAGAINPNLHPGDIVIAQKVTHHDEGTITPKGLSHSGSRNLITGEANPTFFHADSHLFKLAQLCSVDLRLEKLETKEKTYSPKIISGVVVTGDTFIASSAKVQQLRQRFNADAVETEGAAVAQVCHQLKVPCIIIRSISDYADEDAGNILEKYCQIASDNAASLVLEILGQLARNSEKKLSQNKEPASLKI